MINEIIVTSLDAAGAPHFAPMGVHWEGDDRAHSGLDRIGTKIILAPFRPSTSLDNFTRDRVAVLNFCDDVRLFAACILGGRDFPTLPTTHIKGIRLADCLAHAEIQIHEIEDNELRPKCHGTIISHQIHKSFAGFNRAQFAVIEAAILYSRRHLLPRTEISEGLARLAILVDKTASINEHLAWQSLNDAWQTWQKN